MAQTIKNGAWRGIIHYETVEVPFIFNLKNTSDSTTTVIIRNAEEEIHIKNVVIKGDSINIPMYVFDAEIKAILHEDKMIGVWHKNYKESAGTTFSDC